MIEWVAEAFWTRVNVGEPDECWPWLLSIGNHGYGQWWPMRFDGTMGIWDRNWLAHRLAWFLTRGPIPPGRTIDHKCRVRRCCNPRHLRLMTNVDNARDNGFATRTHCPQGHEYDDLNTYRDPKGHRRCRTCARDRVRRRAA